MALQPLLHALDQTSQLAKVSNTVIGAHIALMKAGVAITTAQVTELDLAWSGQTMVAFDNTLDLEDRDHKFWQGDFTGSGKTEILFFDRVNGANAQTSFNWFHGTFTGNVLTWQFAGNTKDFGDLLDGQHPIWIGDFTGGNKLELLFYHNLDHNWWLGSIAVGGNLTWQLMLRGRQIQPFTEHLLGDNLVHIRDFAGIGKAQVLIYFRATSEWRLGTVSGSEIIWHTAGNTSGFGDLLDNQHLMWIGAFAGQRNPATGRIHQQILFNYTVDGRWWLGTITGSALTWVEAAKEGFGDLNDGQHSVWLGDFSGRGHTDVLFYYRVNGEWFLGTTAGSVVTWKRAAIKDLGNLVDGRHQTWIGDFAGLGRDQVLVYSKVDSNWSLGEMDAGLMKWHTAGNTSGFGNLLDKGHRIWQGGFGGNGRQSLIIHYNGDGNWWHGQIQGTTISWSVAGNTRGYGNLFDAQHHIWHGHYTGSVKSEFLFHYREKGRFYLGQFDGAHIPLPRAFEPGEAIHVTQTIGTLAPTAGNTVTVSHNFATQHYDRARSGWNFRETALNAASVHKLRKLYTMPTDDQIYTQPLYVANIMIDGQVRNVIYVATESDTVYAFDADSNVLLLRHSLLRPAEQPVPSLDIYPLGNPNIYPVIGVTGTPVIDCATSSLFVVSKCKTPDGKYHQRLHSLDLNTLGERPCVAEIGAHVTVTTIDPSGAVVPDIRVDFDPLSCNQRCALLLSKGFLYVAFGSHGDQHAHQYHGWVLAFDTRTLNLQAVFNAAPADLAEGGVWQSGHGPAADDAGNVYFTTGNGIFSLAGKNYSNCVMKLSPRLGVTDYFAVADQERLNKLDMDLGSGGVMLLPDQSGNPQRLLLTGGKEGYIYLLDRDHLGREEAFNQRRGVRLYDPDLSHEAGNPVGSDSTQIGIFGGPGYFALGDRHFVFLCGQQGRTERGQLVAYEVANGALTNRRQSLMQFPGSSTPAVTGQGTDALVWMLNRGRTLRLVAMRTSDLAQVLFPPSAVDNAAGPWNSPSGSAFLQPTMMNGKVYVPSSIGVTVFSL